MRHSIATIILSTSSLVFSSPMLPAPAPSLHSRQHLEQVGNINFEQTYSTCQGRERDIIRAFEDMHLLTDAVKGIDVNDGAFTDYFGKGWDQTPILRNWGREIDNNIQKAAGLVRGNNEATTKTIYVTCEVRKGSCSDERTLATTFFDEGIIVFCPFVLDASRSGANLNHVADRVFGEATARGSALLSWQHVALHELLHIRFAGYNTIKGHSEIVDLRARMDNLDTFEYPIYGSSRCYRFAQFKQPSRHAMSNADSYAWMATAKYYRNAWGTRVTRREFEEDMDDGIAVPDSTVPIDDHQCENEQKPEDSDCSAIEIPAGQDYINLDGLPCYSNGNRAWCDVHTYGTCQVTIGYDTNEGRPNVSNDDLKKMVDNNINKDECGGHVEDNQKICSIGPTSICTVPWKFCLKRVGVDCM